MSHGVQSISDRLTNDELSSFEDNGFLIVRGLLDEATRQTMLDRTKQDLRELIEPIEFEADLQYPGAPDSIESEGGKTARRLKAAHERDPVFLEYFRRPAVENRLAQLLGSPVVMPTAHHNCIMTKHPSVQFGHRLAPRHSLLAIRATKSSDCLARARRGRYRQRMFESHSGQPRDQLFARAIRRRIVPANRYARESRIDLTRGVRRTDRGRCAVVSLPFVSLGDAKLFRAGQIFSSLHVSRSQQPTDPRDAFVLLT